LRGAKADSFNKAVAAECAKHLKKASLELGGKDPAIVLEDADLELVANGLVWGAYGNSGQVCTAIERVYVPESIADSLIEYVVSKTKSLRLGTDIAPLVSKQQLEKVENHIADALAKGAKILIGGTRPQEPSVGFWYLPTVLTEVDDSMAVMSEETFGPILPIARYKDLSEAIRLANGSCYGLGASVWTKDIEHGKNIAGQLEAGMVWINDVNIPYPQCPWGGVKNSGIGVELSDRGILEFTRTKHINLELGSDTTRPWWYPYPS
jgi:acyl-CoA reductase-like NAD-dependent aldehyde dehydrogenase